VDLDEILYGDDDTEVDLDSILFNAVASAIPKWRTFKLLRWMQFTVSSCRESRHISSSQNFLYYFSGGRLRYGGAFLDSRTSQAYLKYSDSNIGFH
jgi:hypothetical protein